ncbi:MAG: TnsA-like heteromeric transposase endonuclease subunit [Streptomyces sp.]|nr:TnsA-like heteromeric transposase endonuclease subunit [Streptomyces sp.]
MRPPKALGSTELRYCTASGDEVVTSLADVEVAAVVGGSPVREFSWRPRQGNYPGWLWTSTTRTLVGYESLLERDRVLLADFDVSVTGIASQPFWLSGRDEGVQRRHAPDYLLACADGSVVVVDVKPARMCQEPQVSAVLEWTGRLCRSRGWRYEVFHGGDAVVMANLRFLAQGRRSMFLDEECVSAVSASGRSGMTLGQIEARVSGFDPMDVRASVLALLWRQAWTTDLGRPLSRASVISVPVKAERCRVAS